MPAFLPIIPIHSISTSSSHLKSLTSRRSYVVPLSCSRRLTNQTLSIQSNLKSIPIDIHLQQSNSTLISSLQNLANSSGALGRGIRACLIAFYQRAIHLLPSSTSTIYVEIGPAYVLAAARLSPGRSPTRYAVEQKAWPALQNLLCWQELSTIDARARGATLRPLPPGRRFGRHLFIPVSSLEALLHVAQTYVTLPNFSSNHTHHPEALIRLRRAPRPGARTVAARCPRIHAHANRDRNPSLVLWMNPDGRTGGAMCSVCTHRPGVQLTWRVEYRSGNIAALRPPRARRLSTEIIPKVNRIPLNIEAKMEAKVALVATKKSNTKKPVSAKLESAIGGCVLTDTEKVKRVGQTTTMAYVTASLRIAHGANTTAEVDEEEDTTRLRTVGTMAKQQCPMQVLLWSDRRSKGPRSSQRVEEVAWFACHAIGGFDEIDNNEEQDEENNSGNVWQSTNVDTFDSEEWLPTPLISVSAMRPSAWRDVISVRGRQVSVPASWEASVQAWVLFDIDDLQALDGDGVVANAGNKMTLAVRRDKELSGRCVVMQTGPSGLHVWAELREVRETPAEWFRKTETREWYAYVGKKLLSAVHRAGAVKGKVDMSSCAAGRFARRPGWRLLEDGSLFRSHVVAYVPSTVRNRKPRSF